MKKPLAIALLAALAACTGGPTAATPPAPPNTTTVTAVPLVGVGDSLTAGYQSGGFNGDLTATSPLSAYPLNPYGGNVPAGQENGFWSLLYQAVTGTPAAAMYNAPTSPLPLIKGPGLGAQLVLVNIPATSTSPAIKGFLPIQSGCAANEIPSFSNSGWTSTRLSATAPVTDLGVPGITMHEAVSMTHPITGAPPAAPTSCGYPPNAADLTAGGLQTLVAGESALFYPVLGQYTGSFSNPTMLNIAVAQKAKLATVWLGANDLLKFIFSNGQSPVSDSPTQLAADLTQIVTALQGAGSKVLVADLPTVLTTPQFFPDANLTADFGRLLIVNGIPAAVAPTLAAGMTAQVETAYKVNGGGYLTETGFLQAVQQGAGAIAAANASGTLPDFTKINLDAASCGNGTAGAGAGGCYITPTFAATINTVNTAYNTAIKAVATGSGTNVAYVPINRTFAALAAPGANLSTVLPGAPSATLQFGGGLLSWDGLHPSNLGYGVIAYAFIQAADAPTSAGGLGLSIPQPFPAALGAIAGTDPYNPTLVNAGLGAPVFPLP